MRQIIIYQNIEDFFKNPKSFTEENGCNSLTGKFHMVTGSEKNPEGIDKIIRNNSGYTRASLHEKYGIEGDEINYMFVSPTKISLMKMTGLPFDVESLKSRGLNPTGHYFLNLNTNILKEQKFN